MVQLRRMAEELVAEEMTELDLLGRLRGAVAMVLIQLEGIFDEGSVLEVTVVFCVPVYYGKAAATKVTPQGQTR